MFLLERRQKHDKVKRRENFKLEQLFFRLHITHTICPRSLDPFEKVSYLIKWVNNTWELDCIRELNRRQEPGKAYNMELNKDKLSIKQWQKAT